MTTQNIIQLKHNQLSHSEIANMFSNNCFILIDNDVYEVESDETKFTYNFVGKLE